MFLSTFLLSIKTYIPVAIIQMLIASFVGIFLNSYSDEKFTPRKPTGEKYSLAERLLINLVSTLIGIIGILILGGIFVYLSIWITNSLLGLQLSPLNACMYTTIFAFIIFLVIFVFLKLYIGAEVKSLSKQLNEIEQKKESMYKSLAIQLLSISTGKGLSSIKDNDLYIEKIGAMRGALAKVFGYIMIGTVETTDSSELDENEYTISIRGMQVASGYVYPDKVMVKAKDWDETGKEIPENAIVGVAFNVEQCYWVNEVDAKGLNYMLPDDVIIKHEEKLCIQYVDKIMVNADVEKYLETVKTTNPKLVETLLSRLDIEDIRDVFVNLIRERVSIKDAPYIVDRLSYHAREDKKPEYLSEQLRSDLALQICSQNIDEDKVIYATKLSKEWIKTLSEVGFEEDGRSGSGLKFALDEAQKEDFIQEIGTQILKAQQITNKKVALLCPKHFRLVIYRMLSEPLPDIIVLAEEEIQSGFKVEEV